MVRGQKLRGRGRILLPAGPSLAPTNRDADPRPLLLGSILLRGGSSSRRALRAPRRRFAIRARPLEEALAAFVEPRGWCLDRPARRWGHPPGWQPRRREGDLGAPLRSAAWGGGRPRLRPLPRPRLRSGRCLKGEVGKQQRERSASYVCTREQGEGAPHDGGGLRTGQAGGGRRGARCRLRLLRPQLRVWGG